jgi:hypothetical protein
MVVVMQDGWKSIRWRIVLGPVVVGRLPWHWCHAAARSVPGSIYAWRLGAESGQKDILDFIHYSIDNGCCCCRVGLQSELASLCRSCICG